MLKIYNETCKNQISPAIVDDKRPVFGWKLASDRNHCYQKSYRITFYDRELLWDSGCIESGKTFGIVYDGPKLLPAHEYTWQVHVTDNAGEEAWSKKQTIWTGMEHWSARWIEPDPLPQLAVNPLGPAMKDWQEFITAFVRGERTDFLTDTDIQSKQELEPYDPAVVMRRNFKVTGKVNKARMYVTAHGIYSAVINGQNITNTQLNPGFTTYEKRLKYQIFDITEFLMEDSENELCIEVADGWYKGKIALGRGCEYGEVLGALLELHMEMDDGSKKILCSDEHFSYTYEGPVRMADLYKGQTVDARKTLGTAVWKPVMIKPVDEAVLEAQEYPGVVVFEEIPAKEIIITPAGETVVDFGQNMAGHIRVKVIGETGSEFTFEHGETLDAEGNFFYIFNGDMTREQKDTYICRGGGEEIFEPEYTYHGFRYVRVGGGNAWSPEQFTAMAISTDNPVTGTFETSDEKLNQLEHNIYWSQRANMVSIPTDCPTREKAGWTGDVFIYGATALWHQDLRAFFRDWLNSVRQEQLLNGGIQNTVPLIKNYVQQVGMTSMGWGDVILTLPWQLYHLSGEENALAENYEAMERWMARVEEMTSDIQGIDLTGMSERHKENQRYLINTGFHFGDWLIPSIRDDRGFSDGPRSSVLTMQTTCSAIVAFDADLFADISHILGKTENEQKYRAYANRVREAFEEELCTEEGLLCQELQGNYVLALHYQMVPEQKRKVMQKRLCEMIVENEYRLDTGFMSVPHLLDTLYESGEKKLAWKMLMQNQCPGWMYEVEHGATTMWESWDAVRPDGQVSDQSLNHYAFGCVGDYLYRRIAGIQNEGRGYDIVRFCPDYACGLEWVSGTHESAFGAIALRWEKKEEGFHICGQLPPNTKGTICLPDGTWQELENGKFDIWTA